VPLDLPGCLFPIGAISRRRSSIQAGDRRPAQHHERTGQGQRVQVDLLSSLLAALADAIRQPELARRQVNDIAGAFELAQRLGLQPLIEVPRAGGGVARLTRNPIGLSATPAGYRSAPPPLAS
jgi:crotonobetainyl-CoA:carnitine CoA-transferase CaiB-like acyl-CoA transferase